jgi:hypothetical protein
MLENLDIPTLLVIISYSSENVIGRDNQQERLWLLKGDYEL